MARKNDDNWTQQENSIIKEYIAKYNSLSGTGIAEKIKLDRPDGIKTIRYEGSSLCQHVRVLRKEGVA